MNFADAMKKEAEYSRLFTRTANSAFALNTTGSPLLDLFAKAGALRSKSIIEVISDFADAFNVDPLLATKLMFYTRNIRGGLGERDTFRKMLVGLAFAFPEIVLKNLHLIPHYGRWDDLYILVGTPIEEEMWIYLHDEFKTAYEMTIKGEHCSLIAKWLKSPNTSSPEANRLGKLTAKKFSLNEKSYRKMLSKMRAHLSVAEKQMSAQEWEEIQFGSVPSKAMSTYKKAFASHQSERFAKYLEAVSSGEDKINASTLYPYDILHSTGFTATRGAQEDAIAQAQWESLPNYVEEGTNCIVMADTSGSMVGLPLETSLGLAIYFAERNIGAFHNLFMTFDTIPQFVELRGNTLAEKLSHIEFIIGTTDLELAFLEVLRVALENDISQAEMPKSLIIVSDMQFNQACRQVESGIATFYEKMKATFQAHGYGIPKIIFWNVNQDRPSFQAKADTPNVYLVSGHSSSVFRQVLRSSVMTPIELMLEVLNDPMYDLVKI